jgi:hypothetical protein
MRLVSAAVLIHAESLIERLLAALLIAPRNSGRNRSLSTTERSLGFA